MCDRDPVYDVGMQKKGGTGIKRQEKEQKKQRHYFSQLRVFSLYPWQNYTLLMNSQNNFYLDLI